MPTARGTIRRLTRLSLRLPNAPEKILYAQGLLSTERLSLPDFLGIGVPKAGTTWLFRNLSAHPEIFIPQNKELRYFNWHFHRSLRYYATHFPGADSRLRGDITPTYCLLPERRIRFIHRLMPRLKYLILLRNPIERAWSYAMMKLVKPSGESVDALPEATLMNHFASSRSQERANYPMMLGRWRTIVGRDALHVGFTHEIRERPKELLTDAFSFLEVSTDVDWAELPLEEVFLKGPEIPIPARFREFLTEFYAPTIHAIHAEFGERVDSWLT